MPKDPGHYLEFTLQTKKKTIFIPTQANLERFRRDVLKRHNFYRQFHQVGPLVLTKKLNDFAQNCAENMSKKNKMEGYSFEEMEKLLGDVVGETKYHTSTEGKKALTMSGPKVVDFWYEAIRYYNFEQADNIDDIDGRASNFSQIVWKGSTELGVGIAGSSHNNIFVVANYLPKGNWIRDFPSNVFPVKLNEEMQEQKKKEKEKEEEKKREYEKMKKEREEKIRKEEEKKEKEQKELDKIEHEKKELDKKEILNDEKSGKTKKSFNSKFPADPGHYLGIYLKTKKNKVFVPTPEDLERFRRDGLKRHNYYRQYHQVGPLFLTKKLNDYAQYYAETLAEKNIMQHSSEQATDQIYGDWAGENLYNYWKSESNFTVTGADGVDRWYEEIKDYDFKKGDTKNGRGIGHFTQLVWKGTNRVGMGVAMNSQNNVFIVANYYYGGNIDGLFKTNVLPAKVKK